MATTTDDKKIIFSMFGVSKTIQQNQKQVLKNIYLSFFYGAKIGIIGLNGAGKSTLMKIIAGIDQQYQGNVVWSPGYTVGYLPQDPQLDATKTVKENVMEGVKHVYDTLKEYDEINVKFGLPEFYEDPDKMDQLMTRQAELQDIIDSTDAWNMDSKLERAMDALRCPPGDWAVTNLSGGERRRVALCRLLLQKPDVLLLDEPTNHLDAESIDWLEQHLQQYEGTVIAVTHDRYFLDDVSEWILELDRGEGIPWKGNYSSWLEQKSLRMAQEEKTESKRRKTLERELEWVRMAPKARQAKGKARLNSYDRLLNEDQKEREQKLEIFIPNGPRLGNIDDSDDRRMVGSRHIWHHMRIAHDNPLGRGRIDRDVVNAIRRGRIVRLEIVEGATLRVGEDGHERAHRRERLGCRRGVPVSREIDRLCRGTPRHFSREDHLLLCLSRSAALAQGTDRAKSCRRASRLAQSSQNTLPQGKGGRRGGGHPATEAGRSLPHVEGDRSADRRNRHPLRIPRADAPERHLPPHLRHHPPRLPPIRQIHTIPIHAQPPPRTPRPLRDSAIHIPLRCQSRQPHHSNPTNGGQFLTSHSF